ncbi:MAG: cyanophycinase, partial [Planctomycetia bacterium]|nr:cyanophycinase [Planctomycetia bacterium]
EFLARGSPLGNANIVAEGYERGFNFLPGVAIDQHFTQRDRAPDMTKLVERYPQLLGIGVDESTAIVVRGTSLAVIGKHQAHVFQQLAEGKQDPSVRSFGNGELHEWKDISQSHTNE